LKSPILRYLCHIFVIYFITVVEMGLLVSSKRPLERRSTHTNITHVPVAAWAMVEIFSCLKHMIAPAKNGTG